MPRILENLTIGAFADSAGVNVETIRFYQRKGLLAEPDRPQGGIRRYSDGDVRRVKFIKCAQRLGFNLDEIGELLRLDDGTHCRQASALAERKLVDVRSWRTWRGWKASYRTWSTLVMPAAARFPAR